MRFRPWKLILMVTLLAVGINFLFWGYVALLPLPQQVSPSASRLYDRKDRLIGTVAEQNRVPVSLREVPRELQLAFIAIEDSRFYQHRGVDPIGIARAAVKNLQGRRIEQGASTITQQLARNLYLGHRRTVGRKLKEAVLAIKLEAYFSKSEILEMYLNEIYFGQGAYGVEAASRLYFRKGVSELTLGESALLAGIPRRPNYYSPLVTPRAALERQKTVLARMAELGYISSVQVEKAAREPITFAESSLGGRAPYFVDHLVRILADRISGGEEAILRGGLKIFTTLDLDAQSSAEKAFLGGLPEGVPDEKKVDQPQGALVAMDPGTGQVLALIGGRNFEQSSFNRATQARRQPGSAFKPFVYAAAFAHGFTPASTFFCEPIEYRIPGAPLYKPTDYGDPQYHYRNFTLREALITSDNVVSVQLMNALGPDIAASFARRLGIESPLRSHLSLVLGTSEVTPLEMTVAYSTLANGGWRVQPTFFRRVEDGAGRIILKENPERRRVLDPRLAFMVTDILKGVLGERGTASGAGRIFGGTAAGKTGTSQSFRDAWFIGFTPSMVTTVYIGHDQPNQSLGRTGGGLAAPIWARFARGLADRGGPADFTRPAGLAEVRVCPDGYFPFREIFISGTEPPACERNRFSGIFAPGADGRDSFTRLEEAPRRAEEAPVEGPQPPEEGGRPGQGGGPGETGEGEQDGEAGEEGGPLREPLLPGLPPLPELPPPAGTSHGIRQDNQEIPDNPGNPNHPGNSGNPENPDSPDHLNYLENWEKSNVAH
ncbi:MAG: penicillin-binding protein 1A [Firmicutes bacterium]|nr:penicillin-binding protein 1A [Bacillota bacterium]